MNDVRSKHANPLLFRKHKHDSYLLYFVLAHLIAVCFCWHHSSLQFRKEHRISIPETLEDEGSYYKQKIKVGFFVKSIIIECVCSIGQSETCKSWFSNHSRTPITLNVRLYLVSNCIKRHEHIGMGEVRRGKMLNILKQKFPNVFMFIHIINFAQWF